MSIEINGEALKKFLEKGTFVVGKVLGENDSKELVIEPEGMKGVRVIVGNHVGYDDLRRSVVEAKEIIID